MAGTPLLLLSTLIVRPTDFRRVGARDFLEFVGLGAVLLALFLTYVGSLSLGTPAATAVLLL